MLDRIVCLTVDKRVKESTIRHDLEKWGMKVETFLCGDGELYPKDWYKFLDKKYEGRSQAKNYGDCLQQIIRESKEKGHKSLFFLEDDAKINPRYENNFDVVFRYHLRQLENVPKWDLCYLGGNLQSATKIEEWAPNVIRANYILDMQGMIFNESSFDRILQIETSDTCTIDGVISHITHRDELIAVSLSPVLITQYPNYSWNELKYVNRSLNHIL